MTAGSHWLICRPLKRLSGQLCRKKDSASMVRFFCWLMAIMVCMAIGFAYSAGMEVWRSSGEVNIRSSLGGHLHQDGRLMRFINASTKVERISESGIESSQREVQKGQKVPEKGIETRLKKVQGGQDSFTAVDRDPHKKFLDSLFGLGETSRNSKAAANIEGSIASKAAIPPPPSRESSKDGVAVSDDITDRGVASANETATRGILRATLRTFECPSNFTMTDPDSVWFQTAIVQASSKHDVTDDDAADDVIILTPISNVRRHLWKYFQNVCSLTYPHRHISIFLGEDSSSDDTFQTAEKMAAVARPYFKRIEVLRLKGSAAQTSGHARHERSWQLNRRRHLAMARNQLLFKALGGGTDKWVLWLDSDVRHIPKDLVERFISPQKGIVAANCLYRQDNGQTDTFDRNTWRDTEASKRHLKEMPEDFLMLEGYDQTQRKFLNDLKGEGEIARLDGVGGCALFVEADLHRKGLVFPAFVFDHHVETEGMAKMAARMGVEMYGLPSVNVIHW